MLPLPGKSREMPSAQRPVIAAQFEVDGRRSLQAIPPIYSI
jgi:hypothetical protein